MREALAHQPEEKGYEKRRSLCFLPPCGMAFYGFVGGHRLSFVFCG
jgi:hypothetical protein